MKKIITIVVVILITLGAGWYLFKISPQPKPPANPIDQLDTGGIVQLNAPLPVGPSDYVLGKPDAKNTFVVFEDFECPACAAFEPTMQQIPDQLTDTKLVFRIFPLFNIHKNAVISANAALAAGSQGKFWEFSQILFEKQSEWESLDDPTPNFAAYAQTAGVPNIAQFQSDVASRKFKPQVENNFKEAEGLNLQGTPSLFFNGKEIQLGDINSIKTQVEKLYIQ